MLIQIGTNLSNDYFDFIKNCDTCERIGPKRILQSNIITINELRIAIFTVFLLASISCTYLIIKGGALIFALMLLAIILGIGYTAGPFSLAYTGLADIVVILFLGVISTGITCFLQTNTLLLSAFISGIAPGCLSNAILTINNLRDTKEDKKANKKTTSVRFGEKIGKLEYYCMMIIPFFIPFILFSFFNFKINILITSIYIIPAIKLIKSVHKIKDKTKYNKILDKTSAILLLYTILLCIGLLT